MNRRRPRDFEVFSMSFLDTICCAFGAIILLFMLSKFGEPKALEKSRLDLEGRLLQLQDRVRHQAEAGDRDHGTGGQRGLGIVVAPLEQRHRHRGPCV